MVTLVNRAKMSTSTTGTGTITLGSAETGYQSFADAGVADGDVIRYVIEDGDDWEIGSGTYTATGTTLTRTVDESSNSDAALNLTGSAVVFITAAAGDVFQGELFSENYSSTSTLPSATGINAVAIGDNAVAAGSFSASLGYKANANGNRAIALGYAYTNGADAATISTGTNSSSYGALASRAIAIGWRSKAAYSDSIAIGDTATTSAINEIALGGTTDTVKISGAYTLPTLDGTNGQVLTTNGAGAVTFADAAGGSPDLYADNYDGTSTAPSATGENAVAVGTGSGGAATASGFNAIALGVDAQSTGGASVAMAYSTASNSYTFSAAGGNSQTYGASGSNSVAIGASSNARGSSSIALGTSSYVDTAGTQAAALGDSYASGSHSLAAAIASNSSSYGATGANSVAIGQSSKGSGANSFAHGQNAIASTTHSVAIGVGCTTTGQRALSLGDNSLASANYSFSIGRSTTASQNYSYAFGYNTKAARKGTMVYGGGQFSAKGDAQCGTTVLRKATTDATSAVLTSDGSTATTVNQILLENNSVYGFTGTVIAREDSASTDDFAVWEIKGGAVRGATASTTALGSYNINKISESTGAANWSIALSADTTNGAVAITVTGEAAHNIRWVATVHTTEVTY